jgi:hypothetical protein
MTPTGVVRAKNMANVINLAAPNCRRAPSITVPIRNDKINIYKIALK